ncbi:MAG TPA: HAMP domain-containing sensor histidine kinase [Burkholderiales bacterium]|jgi:signal transduction histidine kinase|nr:HAMP domain-containing sensor histidine kinase [Burkholderiales bacterium]
MKQALWTRNAILWAGAALPCLLICALMFGLSRESGGTAYTLMMAALMLLLALTLLMSLWLARLFATWRGALGGIERTLSAHTLVQLRDFELSGDAELDRIVAALNDFNGRVRSEHAANEELSQKLAQSERMATLGRLASGLAHEIRNPLAAVRLKVENALHAPPGAERAAMDFTLNQVARLERLLTGLLSLTQALKLSPGRVPLDAWMRERLASVQPPADAAGVMLEFIPQGVPESWTFDPDHLARAVENLLLNAIAHSPRAGRIELGVAADAGSLRIHVQDEGAGIDPSVREQIFEPFITGRKDGVGLGLTLARAVAVAHGGTLHNVPVAIGARFELEIPWHVS